MPVKARGFGTRLSWSLMPLSRMPSCARDCSSAIQRFVSLIILFQQPPVAVVLIKPPQEKRLRRAPANRAGFLSQALVTDAHERRGLREPAVRAHRVSQVLHRLRIKARHVKVEHRHLARRDNVAAVAEFLPVRAVGFHAEQVAQLRPQHHLLNAVEPLVRAGERAGGRNVRIEPQPFQRGQRGLARKAGDLDIAEPVEGEPRRIDLFPFTLEDVFIHLPGRLGRAVPVVAVVWVRPA